MPSQTITWDIANNWKNFKPPIRPSADDLAIFERYLKEKILQKGKGLKLLVLGSTPELRDMATEHGIVPTVCDYSKENYDALGTLCKNKGEEVFINEDWQELDIPKQVDLIFGEASLNMANKESLRKILTNIRKALKDDGVIVAKTWTGLPTKGMTFESILQEYRTKYNNLGFLDATNQLLLSFFYDEDHGSVKKRYHRMKQYTTQGIITEEEFATLEHHGYENSPHTIYLLEEKELLEILGFYFEIVAIERPKQIGINKILIFVLGKKKI